MPAVLKRLQLDGHGFGLDGRLHRQAVAQRGNMCLSPLPEPAQLVATIDGKGHGIFEGHHFASGRQTLVVTRWKRARERWE